MRIVSGKYKGFHIPVSKKFKARPTTDFAKENLFNILSNHFNFEGCEALDLFSGTGSLAYELASRGCTGVDLVEKDFRSVEFIKSVIDKLQIKNIKTYTIDVWKYIERCKQKYDIILADPPYQSERIDELPDAVLQSGLLKPDGWFVLEHSSKYHFEGHQNLEDERRYGSIHFSIFTAEKV